MRKSSRVISTLLLGATLTTMSANVFAVESQEAIKTKVLAGKSRYETAIEVSKHGWKEAETVVLVNAYAIPDALAATPMAKMENAPILLTEANTLTESTKTELQRLKTKKVVIVGGEGVISKEVAKALKDMKIKVDRVSGVDRIETAIEVAKKVNADKIAVVNGRDGLADALSVAAPAAKEGMAIILSNKDDLGASEKYIASKDFEKTYIVGGEGVVSKAVEAKLEKPERLAGTDRNETNAEVIEEFYEGKDLDNIYLAKDGKTNESELVDALAAGPLAGKENSPVVLVGSKLSAGQKEELAGKVVTDVYEVGFGVNANTVKEVVDALTIREVETAIESAKAVDVNKIEVKFNKAVDTELAKFELLLNKADKTTEKVTVKVTFDEAKTVAILETTDKLATGDYTLNVSRLTEKPLTSAIKVEAESFKEIKLNVKPVQLHDVVRIPFQLLNQYGTNYTDLNTEEIKFEVYNVTQSKEIKGAKIENIVKQGLHVFFDKTDLKVGDEIRLTITFKGVTEQVTIPVIEESSAASIDLKNVVLPEGEERITAGTKDIEIDYSLKDQHGNDIKLSPTNLSKMVERGGVKFTSSDSNVVDVNSLKVDANGKLTFDAKGEGTTKISTLISATAQIDALEITVSAKPALKSIEVVDFTTAYEKGGTATLTENNIKGLDQYGDEYSINGNNITVTPVNNNGFVTNTETTFTGGLDKAGTDSYTISIQEAGMDPVSTKITLKSVPTGSIDKYELKSSLTNILKVSNVSNDDKYKPTLTLEGFVGSEKVALANKPVAYVSSDINIVKVDNTNKMTGIKVGEATITARRELQNGNQTKAPIDVATLKVTVSDAESFIDQIKFEKESETVENNKDLKLIAKDQYGIDLLNPNVLGKFSSENPQVATVNASGKVIAKGKGTTTITFTANNGKVATCKIIVK